MATNTTLQYLEGTGEDGVGNRVHHPAVLIHVEEDQGVTIKARVGP